MHHVLARSIRLALCASVVITPTLFAGAALAQEEENRVLEEVVTTARRREESLLEVPIAVTAYTGEDLARVGTQDIVALAQTTPNVTLEVSRGTNTTLSAFIRGVGQQDPVAGFEAGVGLYIDDVYLNRPQAAVLDIYDVEQIEVLRGPQGTLYGRNTIGGAIKYVTKRLSDQAEGSIRVSGGSYSQFDVVASGSVPLSDTFRIGGAVALLNRDGFGENLNLRGVDNYSKDVLGLRFSAEWNPTDTLFFRLTADYVEDESDPRQGHRLTPGNFTGAPILDDVFDTRSGLNNPEQEVEAKGVSLTAQWDYSDSISFKNILSYREDDSDSPIDFDSLPSADLDVPVVYSNEQFSEEFQILFTQDRWSGVAGFYYLDANAFNAFDVILGTTGDLIGLPGLNAFTLGDVDTETWSIFADFTYDLTDAISLSFGGRYTDDKRTSRVLRQTLIGGTSSFFGGSAIPIATTSDFEGSETFTEFTPRFALGWRPNENHNVYVSYSEGFKGGSFDPRALSTAAPDFNGDGVVDDNELFEFFLFQPESVDTYELGLKSEAFDGRLRSSIAVFFSDYTDVQIPGSVGVDTNGDGTVDSFTGVTSNASDAEIFGVEFEGLALLGYDMAKGGDELSLGWSLGYLDAEYNEFIDAFGVDVADERVFQNTPEWTASATITYEMPLTLFNKSGRLALINTVSHRGEHSQFEAPNPFLDQDTLTLWDLSLVWEDDEGHWRAGIHGKNLTDEEYKVAGYFFPTLGLESSVTAFYGNPATVTATVEYNFF